MAGHTQATVLLLDAVALVTNLRKKSKADCFVLEILMIKESGDLTGQEHILNNQLKV